jgi:polyhydroxyalkanoate synthesis regulator phasin
MEEKKRILELVSKGVISAEEGIHLLEKLEETKKKSKNKIKRANQKGRRK